MEIRRLAPSDYYEAAEIIYECWEKEFRYLSKDRAKVVAALQSLPTDKFFGAFCEGRLLGIVGYSDSSGRACSFDRRAFARELGWLMSIIAFLDMSYEINDLTRFRAVKAGEVALLEFVGVRKECRGKGIASALIRHAIEELGYDRIMIEVFAANRAAELYKKLGFREVCRKRVLRPPQKDYNTLLWLEYDKI